MAQKSKGWERIRGSETDITERLRVPGGWIYRSFTLMDVVVPPPPNPLGLQTGGGAVATWQPCGTVFVPLPEDPTEETIR